MSELTPWFPPEVKPVRKGVYEVRLPSWNITRFGIWRGKCWSWFAFSPDEVVEFYGKDHKNKHVTIFEWRGLSSDPSKEK